MTSPRPRTLGALVLAWTALFGAPAAASTLTVDGKTDVTAVFGQTLTLDLAGAPLVPASLLVDVLPGPTSVFGQTVDVGFTPFLVVAPLPPIPSGGILSVPFTVPSIPSLDGQELFLVGVAHDPQAPFGLDFSNGVRLAFEAPPSAGPPQGVIVGRRAVLDGGDVADDHGELAPGHAVSWALVQAPAGSNATLEDPLSPYPVLVPDVPGDYKVRAVFQTPQGTWVSATTVHAWRVTTSPLPAGGSIPLPSVQLQGKLEGPAPAQVFVDGAALQVAPDGSFGPLGVSFAPGEASDRLGVRILHADGAFATVPLVYFAGWPRAFDEAQPSALQAHLGLPAVAQLGETAEAQLEAADLKGALLALPPELIANDEGPFGFTIFSATIDFLDLTYDPDMHLQLVPSTQGLLGTLTIHQIVAKFRVYGEVLEIPYDLTGTISTDPTVVHGTMVGGVQGGQLSVDVTNVTVDRQNFQFDLNGFIGSVAELFVIESAVKEDVEQTIADTVESEMGPAIEQLLQAYVLQGSLTGALGVDVTVAADFSDVVHLAHGVTLRLDSTFQVGTPEPGSPAVPTFRATPTPPPDFGPTSPSGTLTGASLGVADDFVNQALAAGTAAGLLDGDLTSLLPGGEAPVPLTTDGLAPILPGAGFDRFASGTPVGLRAHGVVPPTLVLPGSSAHGRVELPALEVEFVVATSYGEIPLLRAALSGSSEVDVSLEPDGSLALAPTASTIALEALEGFPGAKPEALDQGLGLLGAVLDVALPQILDAIGAVPLPSLSAQGLTLVPKEFEVAGPSQEHLLFYGDLTLGGS